MLVLISRIPHVKSTGTDIEIFTVMVKTWYVLGGTVLSSRSYLFQECWISNSPLVYFVFYSILLRLETDQKT